MKNSANAGTWTPDRVEQLKALWTEGLSASEISDRLGAVSRSATLGKVHRLGLNGRKNSYRRPRTDSKRAITTKPAAKPQNRSTGKARARSNRPGANFNFSNKAPRPESIVQGMKTFREMLESFVPIECSEPTTTIDVRANQCRWPVSRTDGAEMPLCGAPVARGPQPYCQHHKELSEGRALLTAQRAEQLAEHFNRKDDRGQFIDPAWGQTR
tara:strand:- start:180 stop:818 length:639 start_codon:yes stop_codon:yes gene_type:complete